MVELFVTCPVCAGCRNLNIPETIFSQKKFGTVKVQVPIGAVCPDHQFIIFVDTKGKIRGCEKIDIIMAAPTKAEQEAEDAGRFSIRTFIKMFGPYGLESLVHARVFNYPAYIISDPNSEAISEVLLNAIGESMLPEKYRGTSNLHLLKETNINKIKTKEKKALIMDAQMNILHTPWDEKLKFEEQIINKALEIIDDKEQMIIFQQEILKLTNEAEHAINILENVKEMYEDELIESISKQTMTPKINTYRLNLIKQFIKQRISPKVAAKIKNKVEEFLGLL